MDVIIKLDVSIIIGKFDDALLGEVEQAVFIALALGKLIVDDIDRIDIVDPFRCTFLIVVGASPIHRIDDVDAFDIPGLIDPGHLIDRSDPIRFALIIQFKFGRTDHRERIMEEQMTVEIMEEVRALHVFHTF